MLVKTLKDNRIFLIPYIIVFLFAVGILLSAGKEEIHLFINQYHSGFFDVILAVVTHLGDGLFVIVPAIVLLFYSLRHFTFVVTAYLSTGFITQLLKRVFFSDVIRPSRLLKDADLHLVEGVRLLGNNSFPSGHATSAFALFLCLALITRNRYIKLTCFSLALLVAFSRVYLSQHFLADITFGSMIGILGTLAMYLLFYRDDHPWHAWTVQKAFKHEQHT